MGEARKRRERLKATLCICGADALAGECCFKQGYWFKPAARPGFAALSPAGTNARCYMESLGSCEGKISGEHLVSKAVLEVIRDDGKLIVGGTPWLDEGEFKPVGLNSLTANCLCERHNSCLSPFDAAAARFFRALRTCQENPGSPHQFIASGHDLERWLLKTLKAISVSGNLAMNREKLLDVFVPGIDMIQLLDDPAAWPKGAGVYALPQGAGKRVTNWNQFQLRPLLTPEHQLCGLWAGIFGMELMLLLMPVLNSGIAGLEGTVYRPAEFQVVYPEAQHTIRLSWEDGRVHPLAVKAEFVGMLSGGIDAAGRPYSAPAKTDISAP